MNAVRNALALIGAGLQSKASWHVGGTGGTFNSGNWVDSNRPGNRGSYSASPYHWNFEPNSHLNYAALVGDLWSNSAVQAVLNWIIRAWPESYPCVKEMNAEGKKERVDDHPLSALLEDPNSVDDDTALWAGTVFSFWTDGNAYWGINRLRNGDIGEFVYLPHQSIYPFRYPDYRGLGPQYFRFQPAYGPPINVPPEDIVHFRFGVDPYYTLCGMSAWKSVYRNVYVDNEAAAYAAATLRNRGSAWMIISPDFQQSAGFNDPEGLSKFAQERTSGENRGGVMTFGDPTKVIFPPSMKEQGIGELHRIPETRICALAGIPAIVVGLASGLERSTFANYAESEAAAWNTIVAVQRMLGRQLTKHILHRLGNFSQFERGNVSRRFWAGFDYSEVRALQPDKTVVDANVRGNFMAGLLDEDEARIAIGYPAFTAVQKAEREARRQEEREAAQSALAGTGKGNKAADGYDAPALWVSRLTEEIEALEHDTEDGHRNGAGAVLVGAGVEE